MAWDGSECGCGGWGVEVDVYEWIAWKGGGELIVVFTVVMYCQFVPALCSHASEFRAPFGVLAGRDPGEGGWIAFSMRMDSVGLGNAHMTVQG